jgi:hypothetical protein
MTINNYSLFIAGILSTLAAITHVIIIFGGAAWYRFFGAGEEMAKMSEQGILYPSIITAFIALVLFIWALYGFSAAGLINSLPFMRLCLAAISLLYLTRGLVGLGYNFFADSSDMFMLVSSLICLGFAVAYIIGTIQVWDEL